MKEKRIIQNEQVNLRAIEEDGKRFFSGYAAVFNKRSRLLAERGKVFFEFIERNAFEEVLQREDLNCVLTFNHKRDQILGRTKSGTLTLGTDDTGLFFRAEVPNTTLGNDTWEMVQRGDYPDCSFVFTIKNDRWQRDGEGNVLHYVERVSGLYDVAIVVDGAYEDTIVSAEYARTIADLEQETNEDYIVENDIDKMKLELLKIKK